MPARRPTGKPRTGEQNNQDLFRTATASVTGNKVIDPGLTTKSTRGRKLTTSPSYVVISTMFVDAGGTPGEDGQRLSHVQNADGTFTIYIEKTDDGVSWIPAVAALTVRWVIMVTG